MAGVALVVFSAWLALEGAFMPSIAQLAIAGILIVGGLWLRHRGITASQSVSAPMARRWGRFAAIAIPALLAAYVGGYFALMDRHRPTHPAGAFTRFDSSLRRAPREWVYKAKPPYETPWRSVTTWNVLYRPMDRLWFHFFPRPRQEVERLREMGYYR